MHIRLLVRILVLSFFFDLVITSPPHFSLLPLLLYSLLSLLMLIYECLEIVIK